MKNKIIITIGIIVLLASVVFGTTTIVNQLSSDRVRQIDTKITEEATKQGITEQDYKDQIVTDYMNTKLNQELQSQFAQLVQRCRDRDKMQGCIDAMNGYLNR